MEDAVAGASLVVVAVPSQGLRAVVHRAVGARAGGGAVRQRRQGARARHALPDVAGDRRRGRPGAAGGGAVGADVRGRGRRGPADRGRRSRRRPREAAALVQREFRGPSLRLYATDDVAGVEIGGALKNVVAIAAGVVESLGLGHNAMAALITRGLVEISRLATAMGGRPDTLAGLSGLGDLVLTCTGHRSRNRQVGIELGRGRSLDDILRGQRMVAEGVRTAQAALELGARHGVELPITEQMQAVIDGVRTPKAALAELMLRPQKSEADVRRS